MAALEKHVVPCEKPPYQVTQSIESQPDLALFSSTLYLLTCFYFRSICQFSLMNETQFDFYLSVLVCGNQFKLN